MCNNFEYYGEVSDFWVVYNLVGRDYRVIWLFFGEDNMCLYINIIFKNNSSRILCIFKKIKYCLFVNNFEWKDSRGEVS